MDPSFTDRTKDGAARSGPGAILAPSGKSEATENFPVGSLLISARLRPHVAAYYAWARAIDDIADHPDLSETDKLKRLDSLELALAGAMGRFDPELAVAWRLRESLLETGVPFATATDLLVAFRQDVTQRRYESWEALMEYCMHSAAPVGRFLLHLHGETDEEAFAASDALCNALQVINHLQDCREDYISLDRIYLPQSWMREAGAENAMLAERVAPPALRAVFDRALSATEKLMRQARALPKRLSSRRLALESAVIVEIATALLSALARRDPLREKVKLSRFAQASCLLRGIVKGALA